MAKLVLALVSVALAACSTSTGVGSVGSHPTTMASASRLASPSLPAASPSPSSGPGIPAARQAAIDGVSRLTGDAYVAGRTDPLSDGCPSGATKCFDIESEIDGVRSAYFHVWLQHQTTGSLCLTYVVEDQSGWRFLNMTCSPPESGGPEGPDIGQNDIVGNTGGSCANVRQSPGLGSKPIGCLRTGTDVTIDGGPVYLVEKDPSQSHLWWHLSGRGWMAHDFLIVVWILP